MMRKGKVFSLVLVLLLVGVTTGIFAGGAKESGVVVHFANFWVPATSGTPNPNQLALQKWEKLHPEVSLVQDISQHDPYLTVKFKTWMASNTLPEVFLIVNDDVPPAMKAKQLMDWKPVLDADTQWSDMFLDGMFNETTINGGIYGVPMQFITNENIFYNSDVLKQAGYTDFPKTWEDLLTLCEKVKGMGYIPISLGDKAGWPLASHLLEPLAQYLCGPQWVATVGAFRPDASYLDPRFVNVLRLINDLKTKGYLNSDVVAADSSVDDVSYLYNRKAAMLLSGSWRTSIAIEAPKDLVPSLKCAAIPRPGNSDPGSPYGIFTGGSGWEYGANTKLTDVQKTAVVSFVKYMNGPEASAIYVENSLIPVLKMKYVTGWDPSKVSALQQMMNANISQSPHIYLMNQEQNGPKMSDAIYKATQAMLAGQITPEQAAQQIEDQYKVVVAEH